MKPQKDLERGAGVKPAFPGEMEHGTWNESLFVPTGIRKIAVARSKPSRANDLFINAQPKEKKGGHDFGRNRMGGS